MTVCVRDWPVGLRVLANSDSNMPRFESRRPSQPVWSPMPHMRMSLNWRGGSGFEAGN